MTNSETTTQAEDAPSNPDKLLKHIITIEMLANSFDDEGFNVSYNIKHDRVIEGLEVGSKPDRMMNDMAHKLATTIKHLLSAPAKQAKKRKKFNGRR